MGEPVAKDVLVRNAEVGDIPQLLRLCEQASTSGVCPGVPMDQESISIFAEWLIRNPDGAVMVAEQDSKIIAAGGIVLVPYHFNFNIKFGHGVFLWRDIEHPGAGGLVVRRMEDWAKRKGAHKVLLTTNDTIPYGERAAAFLSRRGYNAEETNFVRTF